MQIAARRPAFAKPSMNGLGGMFALVEERREQGFYAPGRNHRAAASTDSEAEGKEEPVNQLRSVVGPTSSASSTSEAPERSESGDDPSAKPSDQDSQEEK